VNVETMYMIKT